MDWPGYTLTYRYDATTYAIQVANPGGVNGDMQQVTLNGEIILDSVI